MSLREFGSLLPEERCLPFANWYGPLAYPDRRGIAINDATRPGCLREALHDALAAGHKSCAGDVRPISPRSEKIMAVTAPIEIKLVRPRPRRSNSEQAANPYRHL